MNKPKGWRKGQTIFNFLEWLKNEKGLSGNQNGRLADPFYIEDKEWDTYFEEYLKKHCKIHKHTCKVSCKIKP